MPATIAGGFAGGFAGGRMAVRKGDHFALNIMLALMVVSALILIFGS